ncbi:hypothetical protein MUP77_24990 [Candidatus Bathyarchaeota archaeon]|nr:hypothetical protein [Candidatus Bathyarchaeota archaeon]
MSTQMKEDRLRVLEELNTQIVELRAIYQSYGEEAKIWAEKRNTLNNQSKKIWEEVKNLKSQRDEFNDKIKKLKEERTKLNIEAAPKREKLENLRKKIDELPGKKGSTLFITKRIEELDWEIQTNPLTLTEEKVLVSQIKILEEQMLANKETDTIKDQLLKLQADFSSLRIKANDIHGKIVALAKQSQELHEKMLEKIKEAEAVIPDAYEAHQKFSSLRSQADEAYKNYVEAIAWVKTIRLQIRQEKENEEKNRIEAAMTTGTEQAIKKLKEKRKITLDEFKILKSKGLI